MQYKLNGINTFVVTFAKMTAIMNPIAVAHFFKTTYCSIFKHLLAAGSKDGSLFGPISIYFGTVKTNGRGILHLHCLVRLCGAFCITQLRERL